MPAERRRFRPESNTWRPDVVWQTTIRICVASLLAAALACQTNNLKPLTPNSTPEIKQTPGNATPNATTTPVSSPVAVQYRQEKPLQILLTSSTTQAFTLDIRDAEFNPVRTDLWLYRQDPTAIDKYLPFSDIEPLQTASKRRSGNFMLPASLGGVSTGFFPADDGGHHGVMTDGSGRTSLDGRVDIKLGSQGVPSGTKILVAAALEDQRYFGARVFELPSGAPTDAPIQNKESQIHLRTYDADIRPILLKASCLTCHTTGGKAADFPLDTYRDAVDRNFKAPAGREFDPTFSGERMLEPGAPALSGIVRRTRPGLGPEAKKWYGKPWRYNLDPNGNILGDRRMPPQPLEGHAAEVDGPPSYFDEHPEEYKILWDWVAQGAPER